MQSYTNLLKNLKNILALRIGEETRLIEKLSEITGLSYKSVWRRLKGEYKFSFDELFTICNELGISMESLGQKSPVNVSSLQVHKFSNPLEFDSTESHINNGLVQHLSLCFGPGHFRSGIRSEQVAYSRIMARGR